MNQSYNTVFVGKVCIHLDNVDSTNRYAWDLLKAAKVVEGTLITARHQYNGKGQRGSFWESQKDKNLTISLVFCPKNLLAKQQFYLNQVMALGVYFFAKELLGEGVYLKWPNDLYYHNEKLGGILIENSVQQHYLTTSIVGIGININQTEFPADLPNPTSLRCITGQVYDLPKLLQKLCSCLEVQYMRLKAAKLSAIRQNYLTTLYRFGEYHFFRLPLQNNREVLAKIINVTETGQLVLSYFENKDPTPKKGTFDLKAISFIV